MTFQPAGYIGRYLIADLSSSTLESHIIPQLWQRDYIGGYGLGARFLYELLTPGADPLGPQNLLGFFTGPLTGTPAFLGSRYVVVGKSPLTGGWGDANSGGTFGPGLKFAGFDAVLLHGTSPEPVYLWIDDGRAELRSAADLWGLDAIQTEEALQARHGKDVHVACIGLAGERLALISCIINDRGRAAGRSGLGAVMGSKRLKALAVRGSHSPAIAHPDKVEALRRQYLRNFKEKGEAQVMNKYGTPGFMKILVNIARSPILNWHGTPEDFPNADALDGPAVASYKKRKYGCWHCNQACGSILGWEMNGEEYQGHQPEYETLALDGSNLGIDDLKVVMTLNEICNRTGLDTISAGSAIGFAMECYQNGLLSTADLDGLDLRWGNGAAAIALLQRISERHGIGDLLADGVMRAAQEIGRGAEAFAIHSGGQELPAHDPRQESDFGLVYQISPTPGRHTQGGVGAAGMSDESLNLFGIDPKLKDEQPLHFHARAYAAGSAMNNLQNASGLCTFLGSAIPEPEAILQFLNAVTGWELSIADCLQIGERIEVMRLLFGLREGYNPLRARVAQRALGIPPQLRGPTANVTLNLDPLLAEYLKVMDWDAETCQPSSVRMQALGMGEMRR